MEEDPENNPNNQLQQLPGNKKKEKSPQKEKIHAMVGY